MNFKSVTEKSTIYIEQDFCAQVLIYNMIQDIRKVADEEISVRSSEKATNI